MKRILLATFVAFAIFTTTSSTQAQNIKLGIIKLGVRAGGNLSSWRGDAIDNANNVVNLSNFYLAGQSLSTHPRPGFQAGIYASIPVGERFAIEPGVYYSQKGSQLSGRFSSERYDFVNLRAALTNKLNYIDLPVYVKVYVTEGLHFFAGPQVSFLVSSKLNTRLQMAGFSLLNRDWDIDPGYQKVDVAATAGVGYTFTNGFNLRASYDHGLQRLTKSDNIRAYNNTLKVSVGFEF